MMDIVEHNRDAWNAEAQGGDSPWSQPASPDAIQRARGGELSLILTPNKSVPDSWLGDLTRKDVLGLASGGGQQVPLMAAAGARVTSFDNSDAQLELDRLVAEREGLDVEFVQGDMADLSVFADETFDLIFNPVSTCFVEHVRPVWAECLRVLRPGGRLMTGLMNPAYYLFDKEAHDRNADLIAKYSLPYSDPANLNAEQLEELRKKRWPFEFGHTLDDLIGGQTDTGFQIVGFYEDKWSDEATPLNALMSTAMALCSHKPN
jgi:SAM-dependent methyltransferase